MYQADLVSIITPAYRASRFVTDAIRSVQAQTYPHWEMLIVDDCSPDDTCAVVEAAADGDPRVRLIRQPSNGGPAAARNAALAAARGRYIAFLDSDDLWLSHKLEHQLAFMEARNAALSFTQYRRIPEDGWRCGRLITVPDRLDYRQLLKNTAIVTSTAIVDRDKTGDFVMTKTYYDDYALWLSLLRSGLVAHGLAEDLVRYRVVGDSVSRRKGKSALMVWQTYREIEKLNVAYAVWCFVNYAWRGWKKYQYF